MIYIYACVNMHDYWCIFSSSAKMNGAKMKLCRWIRIDHVDGLMLKRRHPSALATDLRLFCIKQIDVSLII